MEWEIIRSKKAAGIRFLKSIQGILNQRGEVLKALPPTTKLFSAAHASVRSTDLTERAQAISCAPTLHHPGTVQAVPTAYTAVNTGTLRTHVRKDEELQV